MAEKILPWEQNTGKGGEERPAFTHEQFCKLDDIYSQATATCCMFTQLLHDCEFFVKNPDTNLFTIGEIMQVLEKDATRKFYKLVKEAKI